MLPMDEAVKAITDYILAPVGDRPRYVRDGASRLEMHIRQHPQYAKAVATTLDLRVTSTNAQKATAAQWAVVQRFQQLLPGSTISLRQHTLVWNGDRRAPTRVQFEILVTCTVGPISLRREFECV